MKEAAKRTATIVMVLLLVLIAGCVPAPGEITPAPAPEPTPAPGVDRGTIEVRVTDPPPADVSSAVVYLTNIAVHQVSDNGGEWITIIEAPPSFDLMAVIVEEVVLGSEDVTAGKYTQIRMDVDRVEVVTTAGDNITAEVPSGKLKIVGPFNVGPGMTTVLTLDFDGEKSLVLPGKDIATGKERALFKPVVKLLVEEEGAEVAGAEEEEEAEEEEVEAEEEEEGEE